MNSNWAKKFWCHTRVLGGLLLHCFWFWVRVPEHSTVSCRGFIKCKAINIKEIPGLFNTKSGGPLWQNYHQIVVRPKLFSLGCSPVAKISELLGSPSSWLDSNFKFSQIYEHYFFDWLCVFPTNKTFIVFDYFISAWPLLWLAPHCTILYCLAQPHCNALYCLAHHHCIEVITPISHARPLNCT